MGFNVQLTKENPTEQFNKQFEELKQRAEKQFEAHESKKQESVEQFNQTAEYEN